MMGRKRFDWIVQLQRNDGQIVERPYSVYWDPARDGAAEIVAESCAAECSVFEGGAIHDGARQFVYAGLTAVLQETPEPIAA